MAHKIITYPERIINELGVEPGVHYPVEVADSVEGQRDVALAIECIVGDARRSFPLGLNADTQGFKPGDTVEFKIEIKPLRLSPDMMAQLELKVGQKLVVKIDRVDGRTEQAGPESGPYVEIDGEKEYLFNFALDAFLSDLSDGDILTVMGPFDRVDDLKIVYNASTPKGIAEIRERLRVLNRLLQNEMDAAFKGKLQKEAFALLDMLPQAEKDAAWEEAVDASVHLFVTGVQVRVTRAVKSEGPEADYDSSTIEGQLKIRRRLTALDTLFHSEGDAASKTAVITEASALLMMLPLEVVEAVLGSSNRDFIEAIVAKREADEEKARKGGEEGGEGEEEK